MDPLALVAGLAVLIGVVGLIVLMKGKKKRP
jgi:LPXTG-motif cell wall-anchored protein